MTEDATPFQGRRLDARFTLLEKLGAGGQGEVWRAHDETRGIDIALKVPVSAAQGAGAVAAFEREHAIAARLEHPSVLKVFPPHRSGDVVVLPMELATGGDLRRLRGAGYLDIIPVLLDIAQALEHAHERGVIHRDLKPGNVLFDARGRVKLADFGAAGTTSTTAADARLQGLSPFTASPEQLRGEAPSERDDIYGLGALAYELLSGYPPYYPHFDLRRAQEEPVPNLVPTRQIPPLLSSLVMRMLAKNRHERPHSMREVIDELDAALNDTLTFDFESVQDTPIAAVPKSGPRALPPAATAPSSVTRQQTQPPAQNGKSLIDERDEEEDEDESEFDDQDLVNEASASEGHDLRGSGTRHTDVRRTGDEGLREALLREATPEASPGDATPREAASRDTARRDTSSLEASDQTRDEDERDEEAYDEDGPDLGLIPDLLVANQLVVTPKSKGNRSAGSKSASPDAASGTSHAANPTSSTSAPRASHAASALAASDAATRRPNDQGVHNDTVQLPHAAASPARSGARDQTVYNDTMQLPAAMGGLDDHAIHNDTVQLPPEPGAGLREKIAAVRGATVNNDTLLLPPEPLTVGRIGARAASATTAPQRQGQPQAQGQPRVQGQPQAQSQTRPQIQPTAPSHAAAAHATTPAMAARAATGPSVGPNLTNAGPNDTIGGSAPASRTVTRHTSAARLHQPALAAGPNIATERPLWESLQLETVPRVAKLEPIRRRRWPIVLLGALAGIAVVVFYWLPRYAPQGLPLDLSAFQRATKSFTPSSSPSTSPPDAATAATTAGSDNSEEAKLEATRENFDRRLAALEAKGAGVWGGAEFAMAKMRASESVGAHDAGNTHMAQDRLADASHLLDEVESKAPQALAAQLATGQKALAAGQEELANQAFELAKRIDPNDRRIADGQRRTHNLNGVLPLLADAQNAENARNYSRAAQDYSQALLLDPGNDRARAGRVRANAAFGEDNYAKSVGSGFAALGAGRLEDARDAFEKARALRPNGSEAAEGLRRVGAALSAKGYASLRQRAAGLEAQERWDEAVQVYNSALQADPSLAFAQEGKDRAAARAELAASMQTLIDRPERLSSQSVRNQAKALLDTANAQSPSGPVLRSLIARLGILLSDYDSSLSRGAARTDLLEKPVRLSLVSDNATAIAIPSIGQFGTFAKREIELKPGRYTVIGTRDGYREVHRDITVSPGQEGQTISVSCSDPI